MATKSSYLIGGLAIAAVMIGALPAAQGIGASTKEPPTVQVNRGAKGDRLVEPRTIAVKKAPTETARDTIKKPANRPTSAGSWTAATRCSAR